MCANTVRPVPGAVTAVLLLILADVCTASSTIEELGAVAKGAGPGGSDMSYMVALPKGRSAPEAGWPVIVFLHGRGEVAGDLSRVKIHGPIRAAAAMPDFPFLVAAPHLETDDYWQAENVLAVLDDVEERWPVNPNRIYLTGLSLGGHGTWATAAASPKRFAAIAPISGRGDPKQACRLIDLPIWSFHGVADEVVDAAGNQAMVDAVRACGGRPGITLYPDVGHDAWTRTYSDRLFYEWLLSHARSNTVDN